MHIKLVIEKKELLCKLAILFSWIPIFAYTVGWTGLVSIGIYGTAFLITLIFAKRMVLNGKLSPNKERVIILFVLFIIFILLKSLNMPKGGFRDILYLGLIIMQFYICFNESKFSCCTHDLYVLPVFLSFIMFIMSFDSSLYGSGSDGLYLHFQNPNILSFALLMMLIYLCLGYIDEHKFLYIIASLLTFYMICLTRSRSSLMSAIVFIFFFIFKREYRSIKPVISILCSLIPVVAIVITMVFGSIELNILGKQGVSGRNLIWIAVIEYASGNSSFLLMGKGNSIPSSLSAVIDNSHNAYMQMLNNYGLVITILFIISVIVVMIKTGNNVKNRYTFIAYIGLVSIFLNCSFETHIVDSIIGMTFMWIYLFFLIHFRGSNDIDNAKTACHKTTYMETGI